MEQKLTHTTKSTVRIAAELEPELVAMVDQECRGICSRATIVRLALMDRYNIRHLVQQESGLRAKQEKVYVKR